MPWDPWDGKRVFTFMPSKFLSTDGINLILSFIDNELTDAKDQPCPYFIDYQSQDCGGWGLIISVVMDYDAYLSLNDYITGWLDGSCLDLYTISDVEGHYYYNYEE